MVKTTRRIVLGICLAGVAPFALRVAAAPLPARGLFVYSSLCRGIEDDGGEQVVLIRAPEGTTAIYEYTEGAIMAPLVAYGPDVKIDDHTGAIALRFTNRDMPAPMDVLSLEGTITDNALTLTTKGQGTRRLPRVRAMLEQLPRCVREVR